MSDRSVLLDMVYDTRIIDDFIKNNLPSVNIRESGYMLWYRCGYDYTISCRIQILSRTNVQHVTYKYFEVVPCEYFEVVDLEEVI